VEETLVQAAAILRAQQQNPKPKAVSRFTSQQLAALTAHFQANPTPNADEKQQIADEVGLTYKQVQTWMVNARYRTIAVRLASCKCFISTVF
jgi:hypothetical protein